ncbi:MAG TPA: hypothetical protein VML55_14920 [Planctomycetaceae bacterium]|nr:hypothetical protein [Planctomycetaceae bacterium]
MRIDWTLTGCTQEDEREIERLWEAVQPAFEARVGAVPAEEAELLIGVHRQTEDPDEPEWDVQAVLNLPTGTLAAEALGRDLQDVLDRAVGDLARQLDELEEQPLEVERRRQGLEAVLPFLERSRSAGRSGAFFAFLQPVVHSFRRYVDRELAVLRSEAAISGESLEAADVLDDVLLRAWERFDRRPRNGKLDLWILALINESLAGCRDVPHESLEQRVPIPRPEPHESVYEETWIEQATYPEALELSEVLAGNDGIAGWDELDLDTRQTGLVRLLGGLSPEQRHALVLSAAEGYEPAEIADLQDRTVDEVLADIALARDELRRKYEQPGDLEDIEDRLDDPSARHPRRRKG